MTMDTNNEVRQPEASDPQKTFDDWELGDERVDDKQPTETPKQVEGDDDVNEPTEGTDVRLNELEEQLQLYSEVIRLRQQARAVKEDRERMSRQLEVLKDVAANHDPALEDEIAALENEVAQSNVQQLWENVCQENPTERLEDSSLWTKMNIEGLAERLTKARERFQAANIEAAELQKREKKLNLALDGNDLNDPKLRTPEALNKELARLADVRGRLKQTDNDQLFHIYRGTYVKEWAAPRSRRRDLTKQRVYEDEFKQTADMVALSSEFSELTKEILQGQRELEDNRRSYTEMQDKLKEQLSEVEENGKEAREMRQHLEEENKRLTDLKQDLQRVVRHLRANGAAAKV